jgi:RimJ/RimL family protein N-acetyltransferase
MYGVDPKADGGPLHEVRCVKPRDMNIMIRVLGEPDAEAYRDLRLTALATSPEAFGSSYEEEARLSLDGFRARVTATGPDLIFGGFADHRLVGVAGFVANDRVKKRHKGTLWGVFMMPEWRGRGLGAQLVSNVVTHAADHVLILQATVVTSNQTARRIYARLGFTAYGIEPRALCIDGVFHDDELLALDLSQR